LLSGFDVLLDRSSGDVRTNPRNLLTCGYAFSLQSALTRNAFARPKHETDAKKMNWISLPGPVTYTKINIDFNWTADEHSRHDKERSHDDTSFRPSSNCVLQSSLNKPSGVRGSKGARSLRARESLAF
jgi:hypothetical protein